MEQMKSMMGKKLKHMEEQLEEEHKLKQAAIKVRKHSCLCHDSSLSLFLLPGTS